MTKPQPVETRSARAAARAKTEPTEREGAAARRGNSPRGAVARVYRDTSNLSAEEMAEVISPDKPLTTKQQQFVMFWAQGESIPNAALKAGFSQTAIAYRLVKMPNVLKLKHEYEAKWEADSQMSRQKVMAGMLDAIEMAKLMAEPSSMIAGWREIGKLCGYYAPVEHKVKMDITGNIVLDKMNSLSDAELLKIISGGGK